MCPDAVSFSFFCNGLRGDFTIGGAQVSVHVAGGRADSRVAPAAIWYPTPVTETDAVARFDRMIDTNLPLLPSSVKGARIVLPLHGGWA